jgi:hypothetical protein
VERDFIGGNFLCFYKIDNIEVQNKQYYFRKYQLSHSVDPSLAMKRVINIKGINALNEDSNPEVQYEKSPTNPSVRERHIPII